MDRSTKYSSKNGKAVNLSVSKTEREQILKTNEELANQALRVLAIAYKDLPTVSNRAFDAEELESDLIFHWLSRND